jgi:hypothetical protein
VPYTEQHHEEDRAFKDKFFDIFAQDVVQEDDPPVLVWNDHFYSKANLTQHFVTQLIVVVKAVLNVGFFKIRRRAMRV